ncbi:MAG TPA: isoprenylcysteine carboxylmethyltransferase family protein [Terriglobales bacterium]|nr:isoprenylcysteine carboxylmethyltransferase family protein [Terriglobales bacterium]
MRFLLLQVVLISLWLYVAILIVPGPWDWVRRAGLVLMMVGAVLFFTARIQLGNSFALRAQARELVTTGLYSKIRNPIYVFSGVMVAGFLIMVRKPYWFLVLAVLAVAQILRSRQEARVLEARFGDRYREYRKHTWF